MHGLVERLLEVPAGWVYTVVGLLVFVEDAIFVGFVIPGETAAVIGGVAASRGQVSLTLMCLVVVLAAVIGDSVGYEVGRVLGPRLLRMRVLSRHEARLEAARSFLARRGGLAVFLGRWIAFFRAVMPALAGSAAMPYRRFLLWNAVGGLVWGLTFTFVGFLAGNSYERIARELGRGVAVTIAALVVVGLVAWQLRRRAQERELETEHDATH